MPSFLFPHPLRNAVLLAILGHALTASAEVSLESGEMAGGATGNDAGGWASRSILDRDDSSLRLSAEGTYFYGPIGGDLTRAESGAGGLRVGDQSLSHMGIRQVSAYDGALTLGMGRNEIYIGGQLISLSGHATLEDTEEPSTTTEVDAEMELNWYRTGYRYWFLFDTHDEPGDELAIAPSAGAGFFNFSYKHDGPGDADIDRSYIKPMPQVGLEAEWRTSDRMSIVGGMLTSVPVMDTPFIFSARLAGKYRVVDARSMKLDAMLGVGYEKMRVEDESDEGMPSEADVNLGPLLLLGIKAEF